MIITAGLNEIVIIVIFSLNIFAFLNGYIYTCACKNYLVQISADGFFVHFLWAFPEEV